MLRTYSTPSARYWAAGLALLTMLSVGSLLPHKPAAAQTTRYTTYRQEQPARRYSFSLFVNGHTFAFGTWASRDFERLRNESKQDKP